MKKVVMLVLAIVLFALNVALAAVPPTPKPDPSGGPIYKPCKCTA